MLTLISLCATYHEQIMWCGPLIGIVWAMAAMRFLQEWGQYLERVLGVVYAPHAQEWLMVDKQRQEWIGNVLCQEVLARRYQRV